MTPHEREDMTPEEREAIEAAAERKAAELGPISPETMRQVPRSWPPTLNKLYRRKPD